MPFGNKPGCATPTPRTTTRPFGDCAPPELLSAEAECDRTYGEGTYDDCYYGGAVPLGGGVCSDCLGVVGCGEQTPPASGPGERIIDLEPCDTEGGCC